jgi:hypothetical protein
MNVLRSFAAATILMLGTMLPASALQGPGTSTVVFATSLTPDWRGVGAYEGTLTLTIAHDGIVNGYYRAVDSPRLSYVTGGLDGKHLWLDLGQSGLSHIDGTYDGHIIAGGTYLEGQDYTFTATPEAP